MLRLHVALLLVCACVVVFLWRTNPTSRAPAEAFVASPRINGELPRLWKAPQFSHVDAHGNRVTLATLHGKPWVADFIFTECTSACPMMTANMVLLQRALTGTPVHFVSFSVDPAHDTPDALAMYAQLWHADRARWTLLATEPATLSATLAGFGVTVQNNVDADDPIVHSSVFFLVDSEGWIRGVYNNNLTSERNLLIADVLALLGPSSRQPNEANDFASLGCAGCHNNPRVAPDLRTLFGSEITLADGTKVTADAAYIRRSLVDPNAQLVAGYQPLMPSYASQLTEEQINALVSEVVAMRSANRTEGAPAALVLDPMCHMTVRASPESIHLEHEGHTVYFCTQSCRDAFVRKLKKKKLSRVMLVPPEPPCSPNER